MPRVGKTFTFDAAHRLMRHRGKCSRLHGHTYRIEVTVEGPVNLKDDEAPDFGMVVDFDDLKAAWTPINDLLDHRTLLERSDPLVRDLGDVIVFDFPPTAECLAGWILEQFGKVSLTREVLAVRLYETPTSWAEVSR